MCRLRFAQRTHGYLSLENIYGRSKRYVSRNKFDVCKPKEEKLRFKLGPFVDTDFELQQVAPFVKDGRHDANSRAKQDSERLAQIAKTSLRKLSGP